MGLQQQLWHDNDKNQTYLISGTACNAEKVDKSGSPVKRFFNKVTGVSSFISRQQMAATTGEGLYAAEVPAKTRHNIEMLPLIMA